MRSVLRLALASAALLFSARAGATDVPPGNLNVHTTWTAAGSPWRLTGDVTVRPGVILTIEPGAIVEAAVGDAMGAGLNASRVELVVQGRLNAAGTLAAPITFRAATAGATNWYGLILEANATNSVLRHATIGDTVYGIIGRTASVHVSDVAIARTSAGVLWTSGGDVELTRVRVDGGSSAGIELADDGSNGAAHRLVECEVRNVGARGVWVRNRVRATVERTLLLANDVGLEAEAGSALVLRNSVLAGNRQKGAQLAQSATNAFQVLNNTFDRNVANVLALPSPGVGLHVTAVTTPAQFVVRNNHFTSHGTSGVQVDGATMPALDTNNAWGNATNYTGTGLVGGVGSTSVNPLYVAPVGPGEWQFVAQQINFGAYSNYDSRDIGTYTHPGAQQMRIVVTRMSTELNYDFLYVRDVNGTEYDRFHGTRIGPSSPVNGSTIRLWFSSDSSNTGLGFTISGYEWRPINVPNYRLQASSPAIDAGNPLGAPADDFFGNERPYDGDFAGGARVDIGAYEWRENLAPVAHAGANVVVTPGTSFTLDAVASRDHDGTIASYAWAFSDATTATGRTVTKTFASTGTYTATLTVTDDDGATATAQVTITVQNNLPPVARAGADLYVSAGASVTFDGTASTDPDGTLVGFEWDFGDGSPLASGPTPTKTFASPGVRVVALTVTDNVGQTATDELFVVVSAPAGLAPLADAGAPLTVAPGEVVTFSGAASRDVDGAIAAYAWDFGDGTTGAGVTAEKSYATSGYYLVTLTVTDDEGLTDSATTAVRVAAPDNAAPRAEANGPYDAVPGIPFAFSSSGSTDPDGLLAAFAWDFGDGTSGTGPAPEKTYARAGTFLVTLTVTDAGGATATDTALVRVEPAPNVLPEANAGGPYRANAGEPLALDGNASTDADGTLVSFAWDFGDGTLGSGSTVTKTWSTPGTWIVRLTVTDDRGGTDTDARLVTVTSANLPPLADAGGPYEAIVGTALALDGSASRDGEEGVALASFVWDLGDGTSAVGEHANATWEIAGVYLVRLTVTDAAGATAVDTAIVSVRPPPNAPPVADAGANVAVDVAADVTFDGSASADPDGAIVSYAWDFGDGETAEGDTVTHAFAAAGQYLVRLTVVDDRGGSATDYVLASVGAGSAANTAPVAAAGDDVTVHTGEAAALSAAASTDAEGPLAAITWDFGDGETAAGLSARHAWAAPGTYTVTLTVFDADGERATDTLTATVDATPAADAGADRAVEAGETVAFDGAGSQDVEGAIAAFAWDFGDGSRADGAQASHAFAEPGVYTVALTVTDATGGTGRDTATVIVRPATAAAGGGCASTGGFELSALSLAIAGLFRKRRS